ncbi:hypothetical protein G7046_g1281 [Stylonectria norvegica]|nr:hypothetical protein G7046_g1281 [Stylonectria norvegica]
MPIIIGVDVGGTNTDAVAIDLSLSDIRREKSILAHFKTPTTKEVKDGIEVALRDVIGQLSQTSRNAIVAVNLGTTVSVIPEFPNANKLARVALLRLCGPYAREVPPFAGLPDDLRPITEGYSKCLPGGLEVDGRVIVPIDEDAVREAAEEIRQAGINNIAIIGTYSPIDSTFHQEDHVQDILRSVLGHKINVTLSHHVAGVGLIERENATVLNASILPFARRTIRQFRQALSSLNISASLFLTKNDGTLITAGDAANLPISTFLSGPTNSLTGAAFLADLKEGLDQGALVLDVGGTTSDVCAVEPSGLPRPAAAFSFLAGVRTNFAVSDLRSIGVGGGSLVQVTPLKGVTIGPQSVSKDLATDARVFGGPTLTTTDIIVAAGIENLGDRSLVADVSPELVTQAMAQIKLLLETVIDEMKTSEGDIPVILVGGGGIICPESLKGVSNIIRPAYSQVANAVGAAMAKVSGIVDTIVNLTDDKSEQDVIAAARDGALEKARNNGAENPEIVEETILPVAYVTTRCRRIIVRAAGHLSKTRSLLLEGQGQNDNMTAYDFDVIAKCEPYSNKVAPAAVDLTIYCPKVQNKRWKLSLTDIDFISDGCGVLGCGGGGDTYGSHLSVKKLISDGASIEVVSSEDLPDDGFIPAVAFMGSPSTFSERPPSGEELRNSVNAVLKSQGLGFDDLTAVMSLEIGGSNGMRGIQTAIWTGKPLVDADLMGRAYPNLWQVTPHNVGISLAPAAASDAKGNTVVHLNASSNRDVEDILRSVCVQMGQSAGISLGALTGHQVRSFAAQRSISLAWHIGRAASLARLGKRDVVDGILSVYPGKRILTGKITRVTRDVRGAFTEGSLDIVPFTASSSSSPTPAAALVEVTFQNENIHAFDTATQTTIASVPDLICVLDAEDGRALGTQDYRYGLRVHVIALVGSPQWTEGEGLKNGGPEAFGLDITYIPAAQFKEPKSVIEEFNRSQTDS